MLSLTCSAKSLAFPSDTSASVLAAASPTAPNTNILACLASSSAVAAFDIQQGLTIPVHTIRPLTGPQTAAIGISFSPRHHNVVRTCDNERVLEWDTRTPAANPVLQPGHELASFATSPDDMYVATGSDEGLIELWDPRKWQPVWAMDDFHLETITQLHFNPADGDVKLLSGSEDGLVCYLSVKKPPDDDDFVISVLNPNICVSQFGFFGPQEQYAWISTGNESLQIWDVENALSIADYGDTLRSQIGQQVRLPITSILNCSFEAATGRLFLLSAAEEGSVIVSHVEQNGTTLPLAVLPSLPAVTPSLPMDSPDTSAMSVGGSGSGTGLLDEGDASPGVSASASTGADSTSPNLLSLAGGHTDVVRCTLWGAGQEYMVTGGEDGLVCLWRPQQQPPAHTETATAMMDSEPRQDMNPGPFKRRRHHHA